MEDAGAQLVWVKGSERREFRLGAARFTVGRNSDRDLVLSDPFTSRQHASIFVHNSRYFLEDDGSKHGTFINGERVIRQELRPNDRIEFGKKGDTFLLFNPDSSHPSDARNFLTHVVSRRSDSSVSDLEMLTLFMEAARKLNRSGVLEDVLVTLIDTLLQLTRSERGFVFVRGDEGGFHLAAGRNDRGENLRDSGSISHSVLREAIDSESEFLVTDPEDFPKLADRRSVLAHELRTVICIPLRDTNIQAAASDRPASGPPGQVRTLLYLDSRSVAGKLSRVSHEILSAIAREAATLLENARLVQREHAMRQYQEELAIAGSIQQRLMMLEIPQVPFAQVSARSIPCTDVGGDFFDVIIAEDQVAVVVADVCGKGITAALLASVIQGMLYGQLLQGGSLANGAAVVNRFLCQRNLGEKYATLLIARLSKDGTLEYVNCGHVPPLIISGDQVLLLPVSNLPVGLFAETSFTHGEVRLASGDRFLVVTDGATEAENAAGELFTYERLQESAAKLAGVAELLELVTTFRQGVPLRDDCTALELVYQPSSAA